MGKGPGYLFLYIMSAFLAAPAWSQESGTSSLTLDNAAESTADRGSRLSLKSAQFVSSGQNYFRPGAESSLNTLAIEIDETARWRSMEARARLTDEFSINENWNYFNAYEAYVKTRISDWEISAGRKIEAWSEWERDWRQGLYQPRYMQHKFNPEIAGLTGLFLKTGDENSSFTLALVGAHIPDLGAHFYTDDGAFASANPWFLPPASNFQLPREQGRIRYSLNSPDPLEVLGHPGAALKFERGGSKMSWRLAAAYKPMPQLLLGFPSRNRLVITPTQDFMSIEINARTLYHTLASFEQFAQAGAWRLYGGLTYENPDDDKGPEDWTAQQTARALIWTASASRAMEEEGPLAARMKFAFLKVVGGDAPDSGEFAGRDTLFERRFQFLEAYQLSFSKPWRGLFAEPLATELRLTYDRVQNGGTVAFASGLTFARNWRAEVEVEFLGLLGVNAEVPDGFLSDYRANDRVGMGMSYVF